MKIYIACAFLVLFPTLVWSGSTYDEAMSGKKCEVNEISHHMSCDYIVGNDLKFAIDGIGQQGAMITVFRSNWEGDYYLNYFVNRNCVTVKAGQKQKELFSKSDSAFVSSRNGKVYKSLSECQSGY